MSFTNHLEIQHTPSPMECMVSRLGKKYCTSSHVRRLLGIINDQRYQNTFLKKTLMSHTYGGGKILSLKQRSSHWVPWSNSRWKCPLLWASAELIKLQENQFDREQISQLTVSLIRAVAKIEFTNFMRIRWRVSLKPIHFLNSSVSQFSFRFLTCSGSNKSAEMKDWGQS